MKQREAAEGLRITFSFYQPELSALTALRIGLKRAGIDIPRTTAMRALIHLTPELEFLAHAVLKFQADAAKPAGWGDERVVEVLSIVLSPNLVAKLDRVVDEMELKKMKVSRTDVMRARILAAPAVSTLAPAVKKFVAQFPDRRIKRNR